MLLFWRFSVSRWLSLLNVFYAHYNCFWTLPSQCLLPAKRLKKFARSRIFTKKKWTMHNQVFCVVMFRNAVEYPSEWLDSSSTQLSNLAQTSESLDKDEEIRSQILPFVFNREAWTFFVHVYFSDESFPRPLWQLDQWKCLVWSTQLWNKHS